MKAIILAGGMGTRLRPLTTTCPKPLLPIGNLPLLARIILSLRRQDICDFVFLLHYQPGQFKRTLGNGDAFDARFEYVEIEEDLGTAGSVKHIGGQINETCLIYSADILAEVPVQRMLDFHHAKKSLVTLALYPMPAPLAFGIVLRRGDGSIARFLEKPSWPQVFSDWINSGVYIIEPGLMAHIPAGAFAMFEKEVFPPLAAAQAPIFGFPLHGYWRDVGTPEDLRLANIDFLHGHLPSMMLTAPEQEQMRPASSGAKPRALWLGENSSIAAEAGVQETVVGRNCRIAAGAKISRSVILDGVQIGAAAHLEGAVIMNRARLGAGVHLFEDVLIGAGATLGDGAILQKNAAVKPGEHIPDKSILTAQKILPTGYIRRYVDGGNLLGAPGDNFNAELLRWVSKAFASQQNSTGGTAQPILLATSETEIFNESFQALADGLCAAGAETHLLREVTLPMVRNLLPAGSYAGGLYLGWEDFSGLLRVALLHPNGKNFSTLEACALERTDLREGKKRGGMRDLPAAQMRANYLGAMFKLLPRLEVSKRLLLGVTGRATEIIARQFLESAGLTAHIVSLPLQIRDDFKQELDGFQRFLAQKYEEGYELVFWMGSAGERMRLLLPGKNAIHFGVSDAVLAQLLAKRGLKKSRPVIHGWLMPEIRSLGPQISAADPPPHLNGMNSAMAKRAQQCGFIKWYGFDGNGGITVSEWMAHQDALMALAHVLPRAAQKSMPKLAQTVAGLSTCHQVLPCPDPVKAQVMRHLIESFGNHECEVHDGVKIKCASGWVVVRLCAGRPALEVFKCSWPRGAKATAGEIESLFGRVLRSLNDWIAGMSAPVQKSS